MAHSRTLLADASRHPSLRWIFCGNHGKALATGHVRWGMVSTLPAKNPQRTSKLTIAPATTFWPAAGVCGKITPGGGGCGGGTDGGGVSGTGESAVPRPGAADDCAGSAWAGGG